MNWTDHGPIDLTNRDLLKASFDPNANRMQVLIIGCSIVTWVPTAPTPANANLLWLDRAMKVLALSMGSQKGCSAIKSGPTPITEKVELHPNLLRRVLSHDMCHFGCSLRFAEIRWQSNCG